MTQAQSAETVAPAKRKDGRGNHIVAARRRHAQHAPPSGRRGLYGRAGDVLFPWSVFAYPGAARGLLSLCNGRATRYTLIDWIRGKRRAPPWAWALLAAALDKRIAEMTHWRDIAKKEAGL